MQVLKEPKGRSAPPPKQPPGNEIRGQNLLGSVRLGPTEKSGLPLQEAAKADFTYFIFLPRTKPA